MTVDEPRRPAAVTVIGWVWIGLAALKGLSGAFAFVAYTFVLGPQLRALGPAAGPPPGEFGLVSGFLAHHFGALALAQVVVAVVILVSAIMFLRLRAWARLSLELVTWLAIAYIVGFGAFWVTAWLQLAPAVPPTARPNFPATAFRVGGAVMGATMMLMFGAAFVVLLRSLRSATVRTAFSRSEQGRA